MLLTPRCDGSRVRIEGPTVEGLRLRAPLPVEAAAADRWLFGSLAAAFDVAV
ncbi:MAG TPA: hypothetical protein VE760_00940 [Acidimicrobiales bacterium]|nr:hypothetical protein [Acidimicrobiales bacterium]